MPDTNSDKQPMQGVPKEGAAEGADTKDGVNDTPAKGAGGESGGGAYPNPHAGKAPQSGGFMSHGGQSEIAYSGPGGTNDDSGENPNAVTKE